MATTWQSIPDLSKVNLFEHFIPVEILVIVGWIHYKKSPEMAIRE